MRTTCKSCGAPLDSRKCEYCGTVHSDWHAPEQSTDSLNYDTDTLSYDTPKGYSQNYDIPQNKATNFDMPVTTKNKLAFNTGVGIFSIINVIVLTIYNALLFGTTHNYTLLGFFVIIIFASMIAALVLYIIGLSRSKKQGISIAGHVLGIIGAGITLLTLTFLSGLTIILFVLAAIFILGQKNVQPPIEERSM